ncbi:MAG: hypothetical protein AABW73_02895 [Nanoarchaeota archaeon]
MSTAIYLGIIREEKIKYCGALVDDEDLFDTRTVETKDPKETYEKVADFYAETIRKHGLGEVTIVNGRRIDLVSESIHDCEELPETLLDAFTKKLESLVDQPIILEQQ